METNSQDRQKQTNKFMRIALVISGILLLSALVLMTIFIKRGGRLNAEKQDLQSEKALLDEENQRLLSEKKKCDEMLSGLQARISNMQSNYDEMIKTRDTRISVLHNRSRQLEKLKKQIEEYKAMEEEFTALQGQYSALLTEKENLNGQIEKLSLKIKILQDSIENSRGLHAYNISPLTKWERWFWADRYNVSRARRVNETAISFEIAGNSFTETGSRKVYLNMLDPSGSVLYPSIEKFLNKETGEESHFTQKKEINYTGSYLPMNFLVKHPERLEPGTYKIKVYIDGELVRSGQIIFE